MKYGYTRASTDGQSIEAQVRPLTQCRMQEILRETASTAKTDRSPLGRALNHLDAT